MSKVLMCVADGYEELEAVTIIDILRRAKIDITVASTGTNPLTSARGVKIVPDAMLADINSDAYDMIVLPGGAPNAESLKADQRVQNIIKKFNDQGRYIAAICAAPIALSAAGVLKNRKVTSYPSFQSNLDAGEVMAEERLVEDGKVITSQGPGTAIKFALRLVELIKGEETRDEIKKAMLIAH